MMFAHGQDDRVPGFSGMTKARDPRPARGNWWAGWLPSPLQMSGLRPPLSLGHLFQARGGYQPDRTECNRDLSGKLGLACSVCTPRNRVEIIWAVSSSETTLICSPARAGKTRALSLRFLTGLVHPHMCEENTYQIPVWICGPGSSPRVRGKRTLRQA